MREPELDRGQTWESYYWKRDQEVNEIQCLLTSAEPWEKAALKDRLKRLWFEMEFAKERFHAPSYGEEMDEVMPWS